MKRAEQMKIKALVMDVDGTLTDGRIYIGLAGECMKAFNVKDGYAIAQILPKHGILPIIITGRESAITERRAEELNIHCLYQNVSNKVLVLKKIMDEKKIVSDEVAYIGDDLNDLPAMKICGCVGCPSDSVKEVLEYADYICNKNGGAGAVREFIDYIVKEYEHEIRK